MRNSFSWFSTIILAYSTLLFDSLGTTSFNILIRVCLSNFIRSVPVITVRLSSTYRVAGVISSPESLEGICFFIFFCGSHQQMDIRWLIFNSAFVKSCFWWVERTLMGPDWVSLRISGNDPWDCSVGLGWAPLTSWKREGTWRHTVQLLTLIGKTEAHVSGLLSGHCVWFIREGRIRWKSSLWMIEIMKAHPKCTEQLLAPEPQITLGI